VTGQKRPVKTHRHLDWSRKEGPEVERGGEDRKSGRNELGVIIGVSLVKKG